MVRGVNALLSAAYVAGIVDGLGLVAAVQAATGVGS